MFIKSKTTTIILGLTVLAGCNSTAEPLADQPLPTKITTESLSPTPIAITLEDLPQPYATQSASKPPKVISVPDNPVLQVPEGFAVNVFADNLPDVRWMTLTPDGDVLAVQSKQNKINLLQDKDRDGVAEVQQVFADPNK